MGLFRFQPQLISVHVPKTAGTTFRYVLKANYGWRLSLVYDKERLHWLNNGYRTKTTWPGIKAAHGHMMTHPNWKEQYPDAKIITWVRDPVERVISHYHFWSGILPDREKPNVIDFAQDKQLAPRIHAFQTYLGGLKPEDFYFIGQTEHFEKDLKSLKTLMSWKKGTIKTKNATPRKSHVKPSVKDKLRELLQDEYEIYHSLLNQGPRHT